MSDYSNNKIKILLVEDSINILEGLKYLLEKESFEVTVASTKKQALEVIKQIDFDLYLLDVQLPDGTGFDVCKVIKNKSDKPVIFISERAEEVNVVYGLDIGADDYISKPFRSTELVSRIKSVLRRYNKAKMISKIINCNNIKVDLDKAKVYKNQKEVILTNLEYRILLLFLNNANKLITRDEILEKIWDVDANFVNDNTLSVYIKRLRKKISDNNEAELIKTVRGMGYMLNKVSD